MESFFKQNKLNNLSNDLTKLLGKIETPLVKNNSYSLKPLKKVKVAQKRFPSVMPVDETRDSRN